MGRLRFGRVSGLRFGRGSRLLFGRVGWLHFGRVRWVSSVGPLGGGGGGGGGMFDSCLMRWGCLWGRIFCHLALFCVRIWIYLVSCCGVLFVWMVYCGGDVFWVDLGGILILRSCCGCVFERICLLGVVGCVLGWVTSGAAATWWLVSMSGCPVLAWAAAGWWSCSPRWLRSVWGLWWSGAAVAGRWGPHWWRCCSSGFVRFFGFVLSSFWCHVSVLLLILLGGVRCLCLVDGFLSPLSSLLLGCSLSCWFGVITNVICGVGSLSCSWLLSSDTVCIDTSTGPWVCWYLHL